MATSQALLASKIVIVEEQPRNIVFPAIPTAVTGIVGVTERGPFGATLVTSWQEYVKKYGAWTTTGDVAFAVAGYFLNGGTTGWVVRTVHYTDLTDPGTKISVASTIDIPVTTPIIVASGKTDGAWSNGWDVVIGLATNAIANDFNVTIQDENDIILEVFPNVNTTVGDARFIETIVNDPDTGSDFVTIADQALGTRPTDGDNTLAAGDDGLTGLADADFVGDAAGPTGLFELDQIENLTLLIVPGRATAVVQNAMLNYAESTRKGQVFAILDPPAGNTATAVVTYVVTTASLKGSSNFGAIYWPRIKIANPDTALFTSDTAGRIVVPPSGHIAGAAARGDFSRLGGIYHNFAGLDVDNGIPRGKLLGAVGLETDEVLDEAKRDLVYPELINPITTESGAPIYIDGTRTLLITSQFPTIAQRRGASFIGRTIKQGVNFARHANITDDLLRRVSRVIDIFLLGETRKGAFVTRDPVLAFFVDFSNALNPASSRAARTINGRVGLAFAEPADFIVIIVGKDSRAIDEEIAALKAGR